MKALTAEWVDKAEGDFITMEREFRARKQPNYDAVGFHAQQCAEKYLKARLCEADLAFPRTHDLNALLNLAVKAEPGWELLRPDLVFLTDFGVEFRYPGEYADKEIARKARHSCRKFRQAARTAMSRKA